MITITKFVSSVWVIIIVTVRDRVRRLLTSIVTERGLVAKVIIKTRINGPALLIPSTTRLS